MVFAVSPACFLTARSLEQIKNDVCYSDRPVSIIGISAGVSYGPLGTTHHSLHDFAVLRAIHNITIIAPADNLETREAINSAATLQTPAYLRFGKKPMPHLPRVVAGLRAGEGVADSARGRYQLYSDAERRSRRRGRSGIAGRRRGLNAG